MVRPTRAPWSKTHAMHAEPRHDGGRAFLEDFGTGPARAKDDLAELAGEEFVASALSGEEVAYDDRDRIEPEEYGGPFLQEIIPEEVSDLEEVLARDVARR